MGELNDYLASYESEIEKLRAKFCENREYLELQANGKDQALEKHVLDADDFLKKA